MVEAAKTLKNEIGSVDILINNAGIVSCKPFWDLSEKLIENTYAVNILSHYWVSFECKLKFNWTHNSNFESSDTDGQGIPSRDDGIEPRSHCDSCIRCGFARHIWLHRLQCHKIRLRRIPWSIVHRIAYAWLRWHPHDASLPVLHCIGHVRRRQAAHVPNAYTKIRCRSDYVVGAKEWSQLHNAAQHSNVVTVEMVRLQNTFTSNLVL